MASSSREIARNGWIEAWIMATMVGKEHFGIIDWLNGHTWHSVSLGTDPSSKLQPRIFSVPSRTEKRNKSTQGRLQAQIIPTYSTCLFNNNIYADFITVYKHILIHSYVIQVI